MATKPTGDPVIATTTNGKHLPGLEARHVRKVRGGPVTDDQKRPIWEPDPLDIAAQGGRHAKFEKLVLDEPIPAAAVESQIVFAIVGRIDRGPWSYQFAGETLRSATFQSRRRAEGIMGWLRQVAAKDGNGCEYRIIPLMRTEQQV
jgi:hypothetical protein